MKVRVIVPPEPIVVSSDIAGSTDDDVTAAYIQAVTESIDGPTGWLNRALGEQTLELTASSFEEVADCHGVIRLPFPPLIEVASVTYLDSANVEQELLIDNDWRQTSEGVALIGAGSWPTVTGTAPDGVKIIYTAGYNDVPANEAGGTGPVPLAAKQAIILSVQHLLTVGSENLFVSVDEVEGVGRRQYVVSEQASSLIKITAERLLAGLRVYP